jgi:hypothetical protein
MANILIATSRAGRERLQQIIEPAHHLLIANTVQEALDSAPKCDVMVCGLEFDESRMFDFLRTLNADRTLRTKPRVCVRFFATNTPEHVIDGLEVAVRALGAKVLVDVPALEMAFGANGANMRIREEIEAAISGSHR